MLVEDLVVFFYLLLRSNPSRQHYKELYRWGSREEERRKSQKSRNEEKVVGFSFASIFPTRKWEAVTQGGTI